MNNEITMIKTTNVKMIIWHTPHILSLVERSFLKLFSSNMSLKYDHTDKGV